MNKDKVKLLICAIVCITLIICGVLFWPTLYRYDKIKSTLIRVNRLTGDTDILSTSDHKWYAASKFRPEDYSIHPPLLPASDKAKILRETPLYQLDLEGPLPEGSYVDFPNKDDFTLRSYLYNGSEWTVNEMMVVIEAKNKDDKTKWKRKYKVNIIGESIKPFSSGSITVEPSGAYGVSYYIWFIDEVYGYKSK